MSANGPLILTAPLDGWCLPLAEVPDPVFAQGLAGDGLAIDPTGTLLCAPCDGELLPMQGAAHALRIRGVNGVEVLVHLGIDTVALKGEGFTACARAGESVHAGQELLRFDLDLIARRAKSAVTPVLLAGAGTIVRRRDAGLVAAGEFLMELAAAPTELRMVAGASAESVQRAFRVPFEHGLHLRPAALIADALRPFRSDVAIGARGRRANARSTTALMALGIQRDDTVEVTAIGPDALAAVAALAPLLAAGDAVAAPLRVPAPAAPADPHRIEGVVASRGLAVGVAVQAARPDPVVPEQGRGVGVELPALASALDRAGARLRALAAANPGAQHAVLAAHVALVDDPDLREHAERHVRGGKGAAWAWRTALRANADALRALGDPRMAERIADLRDIELQVLGELLGTPQGAPALPERAVVLADDLLPSQLVSLERARLAGVCTALGGPSAHVAIIAASLGIPMLVAAGERVLAIRDGTPLILDAERGRLELDPPRERLDAVRRGTETRARQLAEDRANASAPCRTIDGVAIGVSANLGSVADAAAAAQLGADGCGLLRTEFLFLERREAPSEDEQHDTYQRIADALEGRPLTIRTMDIGGDKPIPFLKLPREENPALGLRGLRGSLWQPELLETQLRAILRVRPAAQRRVLLPMVTEPAELREVREILNRCCAALGLAEPPKLGAMVETPASALLAEQLLAECDFLSIGTNDLSQYALAMDRAQPALAPRLDALHPAVLRLIAIAAGAGQASGKHVAVCGGLGSDPAALPILIGLGIREVSAVPASVPELKRIARGLDARACKELAARALALGGAAAVRELVADWTRERAGGAA